jgi:hypothetical protein
LLERVGDVPQREGAVVSDLIDCQKTVERMLSDGGTLPEVEGYVERCALDELEKAGLWMLAWAHQDQATQLRLAKETLALLSSMGSRTGLDRKKRLRGDRPAAATRLGALIDKATRHQDSQRRRSPTA